MEKLPDAASEGAMGAGSDAGRRGRVAPPPPGSAGWDADPGVRVTDANAAIVALLVVIELATAPPVITL